MTEHSPAPACLARFMLAPAGWRAWYAESDPDRPQAPPTVTWEPILAWCFDERGDPFPVVYDRIDGGGVAADDEQTFVTVTGPGQRLTRAMLALVTSSWQERCSAGVDPTEALLAADVAEVVE